MMDDDKRSRKNITGPMVRKIRKRNGWTQKELSKKLVEAGWKKCTRGWLSRVESGEVTLRDKDFPYLYAVLGREFEVEFGGAMARRVSLLRYEEKRELPAVLAGSAILMLMFA